MSVLVDRIVDPAIASAIDLCWRQWRALAGASLRGVEAPARAVIDPEALVLLSLLVRSHERRLDDQLRWWSNEGAHWMSVQRVRTLAASFPARIRDEVPIFAAMAIDAGDPRWKSLLDGSSRDSIGRERKSPRELLWLGPSTSMLRLRAAFSVGAKADLLAFLLGIASSLNNHASWATADVISPAIAWSIASTRRAATELVLARFIDASGDRPIRYSMDVSAWSRVLDRHDGTAPGLATAGEIDDSSRLPPWRFWAQMSALLAACCELSADQRFAAAPKVVQASHLRDLAESFRRPLGWNGIEWTDPRRHPGEAWFDAFTGLLDRVIAWVGASV